MYKITNSWEQGMNQDIPFSKYNKQTSYEIRNFKLVTDNANSTGILENMEGTKLKVTFTDCTILNLAESKDSIIFFLFHTAEGSIIYRINKEHIKNNIVSPSYSTWYHNSSQTHGIVYKGTYLEWDSSTIIKDIKVNYENSLVEKVYFIDDTGLKHINIVYSDKNDLVNLTVNDLKIVTPAVLSKATVTDLTSGNLRTGAYQYTYQLYNVYGVKTDFAPLSQLFYMTDSSLDDVKDVRGGEVEKNTGKGIRGTVAINSTNFTRIRLISVFYPTYEGTPIIKILEEKSINPNTTNIVSFTDTGIYIGTLSENDLVSVKKLITPETIESKDNFLFAGNIIEQDYFDVDQWINVNDSTNAGLTTVDGETFWDSRAFRAVASNDFSVWSDTDASDGYILTSAENVDLLNSIVPAKSHDCLNPFNNFDSAYDGDIAYHYKYQSDGGTLGGEGLNISYSFSTEQINIDNFDSSFNTGGFGEDPMDNLINPSRASNGYLEDYSNPFYNTKKTLPYDEVERYGIQFIENSTGRKSFVKWIGDIRTPSLLDLQNDMVYVGHTGILQITFTVSNIPDGLSWRIVRVPKTNDVDISNKMFGILASVGQRSEGFYVGTGTSMFGETTDSNRYPVDNLNKEFNEFISPDYLLSDNFDISSNAYVKYIGLLSSLYSVDSLDNDDSVQQYINKYMSIEPPSSTGYYTNNFHHIDIVKTWLLRESNVDNRNDAEHITDIPGYSAEYKHYTENDYKGDGKDTVKGTCVLMRAATGTLASNVGNSNGDLPFVAIKVNNELSRYGGRTYNDRSYNIYEPVSEFKDYSENVPNTKIVSVYGDYYISFMDYLRAPGHPDGTDRMQNTVLFPVLSRYNLTMRMDKSLHRTSNYTNMSSLYLKESKHVFEKDSKIYTQDYNLYTYNNIYSKNETIERELPVPFDFQDQNKFSTRVYHSSHKINGEYGDSWIEFLPNKLLDLESKYGELKKLIKFKERIYYFQENCFGTLYINERQSSQSSNGTSIIVAKSDTLDGKKEIDDSSGIQNSNHQVTTSRFIYWYDSNKKIFKWFTGNEPEDLGQKKGMASWFKNISDSTNVYLAHNAALNEVYIHAGNEVLVFSENLGMFVPFIDDESTISNYLTDMSNTLYSVYGDGVYIHGQGDRCYIHGTYRYPSLTLIVSPLQGETFTLDVLEFLIEVFYENGSNSLNQSYISSIQISNNYQDTGEITDMSKFKQRFRKWRFNSIRDSENLNRFNDYYAKITIKFISSALNKRVLVHNIISYFRKHKP